MNTFRLPKRKDDAIGRPNKLSVPCRWWYGLADIKSCICLCAKTAMWGGIGNILCTLHFLSTKSPKKLNPTSSRPSPTTKLQQQANQYTDDELKLIRYAAASNGEIGFRILCVCVCDRNFAKHLVFNVFGTLHFWRTEFIERSNRGSRLFCRQWSPKTSSSSLMAVCIVWNSFSVRFECEFCVDAIHRDYS